VESGALCLAAPLTNGERKNPPRADFRRFGGWAADNEPMNNVDPMR